MKNPGTLKRYEKPTPKPKEAFEKKADGASYHGICDPEVGAALALLITYWVTLEEHILGFQTILLGGKEGLGNFQLAMASRIIFKATISQQARIKLMRSLLQTLELHANRGAEYDAIIAEYDALNTLRNKYAHGLWNTLADGGEVVLRTSQSDLTKAGEPQQITAADLNSVIERMRTLHGMISAIYQ